MKPLYGLLVINHNPRRGIGILKNITTEFYRPEEMDNCRFKLPYSEGLVLWL